MSIPEGSIAAPAAPLLDARPSRTSKWQSGVVHRAGEKPLILGDDGRSVRFAYANVRRMGKGQGLAVGDRVEYITHSHTTQRAIAKAMQVRLVARVSGHPIGVGDGPPASPCGSIGSTSSSIGPFDSAGSMPNGAHCEHTATAHASFTAPSALSTPAAPQLDASPSPSAFQPVPAPASYTHYTHDPYSSTSSVRVREQHRVAPVHVGAQTLVLSDTVISYSAVVRC
eukprot:TRINITY_DN16657_c0_g1_i1.p1 TRINITY_DN16657_c0_g1~~TRINITY_DN16657_c0_g1_i1.p1  ORF type:complete len:252 (+),score=39.97 TRINITY_DN16657_c0_g1_i1:81-758(+)